MTQIHDFADWFKRRETAVEAWYEDGKGRFAFRVTVDGQAFVCAARSSSHNGNVSVMTRIPGEAQTIDALICLRIGDAIRVFDPVAVLAHGETDEPTEPGRRERGESWVEFPVSIGCRFDAWFDGDAEPSTFDDVAAF